MGFWTRWFGNTRRAKALALDPAASFDQELRAAVPRYSCMARDAAALDPLLRDPRTGDLRPASQRFPELYREWAEIRSPWDRRGVLFNALDELLGDTIAPWQRAERLIEDRRPREALEEIEEIEARAAGDRDAPLCRASARALICLEQFEAALEAAQRGLAIAPQDRSLRILAADAQHFLGRHDAAHAIYETVLSETGAHHASPETVFQQLFAFETGALRSPIVALSAALKMPALWPSIEDEFYWSPHVRAQHAYQMARGNQVMRGFAKLVALLREMPWLADATLNCMQIFEALDPGGKNELCAEDRERMVRAIQANGWSIAQLHPLEPIEFNLAEERHLATPPARDP